MIKANNRDDEESKKFIISIVALISPSIFPLVLLLFPVHPPDREVGQESEWESEKESQCQKPLSILMCHHNVNDDDISLAFSAWFGRSWSLNIILDKLISRVLLSHAGQLNLFLLLFSWLNT